VRLSDGARGWARLAHFARMTGHVGFDSRVLGGVFQEL
jgi:hypothetical protein